MINKETAPKTWDWRTQNTYVFSTSTTANTATEVTSYLVFSRVTANTWIIQCKKLLTSTAFRIIYCSVNNSYSTKCTAYIYIVKRSSYFCIYMLAWERSPKKRWDDKDDEANPTVLNCPYRITQWIQDCIYVKSTITQQFLVI